MTQKILLVFLIPSVTCSLTLLIALYADNFNKIVGSSFIKVSYFLLLAGSSAFLLFFGILVIEYGTVISLEKHFLYIGILVAFCLYNASVIGGEKIFNWSSITKRKRNLLSSFCLALSLFLLVIIVGFSKDILL